MNERTSSRIPWRVALVTAFAALLVVQGYLSFAVKPEPYPSIRMPNFGTAAAPDDTYDITVAQAEVVDADGSVRPLSPTQLMDQFRFSTARPSYDYLFRTADATTLTGPVRSWLRERIELIDGAGDPVAVRMCWRRSTISLADASVVRETPCEWKVVAL